MSVETEKIIKKNNSIVFPIRRRACKGLLKHFFEELNFTHMKEDDTRADEKESSKSKKEKSGCVNRISGGVFGIMRDGLQAVIKHLMKRVYAYPILDDMKSLNPSIIENTIKNEPSLMLLGAWVESAINMAHHRCEFVKYSKLIKKTSNQEQVEQYTKLKKEAEKKIKLIEPLYFYTHEKKVKDKDSGEVTIVKEYRHSSIYPTGSSLKKMIRKLNPGDSPLRITSETKYMLEYLIDILVKRILYMSYLITANIDEHNGIVLSIGNARKTINATTVKNVCKSIFPGTSMLEGTQNFGNDVIFDYINKKKQDYNSDSSSNEESGDESDDESEDETDEESDDESDGEDVPTKKTQPEVQKKSQSPIKSKKDAEPVITKAKKDAEPVITKAKKEVEPVVDDTIKETKTKAKTAKAKKEVEPVVDDSVKETKTKAKTAKAKKEVEPVVDDSVKETKTKAKTTKVKKEVEPVVDDAIKVTKPKAKTTKVKKEVEPVVDDAIKVTKPKPKAKTAKGKKTPEPEPESESESESETESESEIDDKVTKAKMAKVELSSDSNSSSDASSNSSSSSSESEDEPVIIKKKKIVVSKKK